MPDPLLWIIPRKAEWPKFVVLKQTAEFSIIFNGMVVGKTMIPMGTKVPLVDIAEDYVNINYNGTLGRILLDATDLKSQAGEILHRALAKAAETPRPTTVPEVPSPTPENEGPSEGDLVAQKGPFVHPGLLHNEEDFKRMRRNIGREPWASGYKRLVSNPHASLNWKPRPLAVVVRGRGRGITEHENYTVLYNDIAAAYACALRWKISGNPAYAKKSIEIMNAWSAVLQKLIGSTDVCLAAGIYGYEFANAAEIMRTYRGWKPEDFARFQTMMMEKFYPCNKRFLEKHNGTRIDHYWANWDICNMNSMLAIGVLCDRRDIYNDAIRYFKHGGGNGAIRNAVYYIHPGRLGQWQESGRDQGHNTLGISLMGAFCEMAWKQGDDLYGYDNNRFLAGCEYVAKYNLGYDVPYKTYVWEGKTVQSNISSHGRGSLRPGWELVYNHYVKLKGLSAPYTTEIDKKVSPEGGGGNYGPNSGGYDQLGYGTLTATLDEMSIKEMKNRPSSLMKDGTASFFGTKNPSFFESGTSSFSRSGTSNGSKSW